MRLKSVIPVFLLVLSFGLWGTEGFGDLFGENSYSAEISGQIGLETGFFFDNGADSEVSADPFGLINIRAAGESVEALAALSLSASDLQTSLTAESLIEELYLKAFFPFGYLEGGYMKVEWGKGDGDHVIDPLNPLDQREGIYLDLNKMKSPEILLKLNFYLGASGLLELVYKPHFSPMALSTEGRWSVFDISTLPGGDSIVFPDTSTLKYSQGAARATASFGPADLGVMYYYGFMTEPGYKFTTTFTGSDPFDPTHYTTTTDIVYTGAHLFGLEGALALGPLTMRGEAGYWLTGDTGGDQPEYYNNRLVYLGGLDVTIPPVSLFISAQIKGAYVLKYDNLTDGDVDRMASYNDSAWTNTVMGAAELPFFRDRMKLRVSGLYQIESEGYLIAPAFYWNIKDDLELALLGKLFGGAQGGGGPYQSWDDNDSLSLSLTYFF